MSQVLGGVGGWECVSWDRVLCPTASVLVSPPSRMLFLLIFPMAESFLVIHISV